VPDDANISCIFAWFYPKRLLGTKQVTSAFFRLPETTTWHQSNTETNNAE